MSADQAVVIALLVAAFAAGWFARGGREDDGEEEVEAPPAAAPPPPARPAPPTRAESAGGGARNGPAGGAARTEPAGGAALTGPSGGAARTEPSGGAGRPDPTADAARWISLASTAFATAVDRWLDERDAITPAGRASVGAVERAVQRLDAAAARLDEVDEVLGDAAYDALEALRDGAKLLDGFRRGAPLDAAANREIDRIEEEVARARATFDPSPA